MTTTTDLPPVHERPVRDFPGLVIAKIRRDGVRVRAHGLDMGNVKGMQEAIKQHRPLPPITVFWDGQVYWNASGDHRIEAHSLEGKKTIHAKVIDGTLREAQLWAFSTNAGHGKQRSDEDKHFVVRAMLADPEWGGWSDREISRRTCTSPSFVGDRRREWDAEQARKAERVVTVHEDSEEPAADTSARTYRTRNGTVSTMKTESIGKTIKLRTYDAEDRAKAAVQWPRTVVKLLHQCDAAGITPEDAIVWGRAELERRKAAGSRRRA